VASPSASVARQRVASPSIISKPKKICGAVVFAKTMDSEAADAVSHDDDAKTPCAAVGRPA